jgi:peptidyl-prolyl cis-trans isomerase SurA
MPEDTLEAYSKILEAKARIERGEPFADVAKDVSEDPSAREMKMRNGQVRPGNGGDLGYFTVFDMVYPFETGAYNTQKGEVSDPVRTDYGYHLIYVTDRIPALGEMQVAHLFLKMPQDATHDDSVYVEKRIDSLYQRILNGEKFEDLVKEYSDDKGSAPSGGVLPKFKVNRMVPEFIEAIAQLPDSGSISKPVLTMYGWHIIKLISKTGIKSFDDSKKELEKKIKKDQRSQLSTEIIIERIKNEYGYKENKEGVEKMYPLVDSSIYQGKWSVPEKENMGFIVFTLGDQTYSQMEFANYIAEHQTIGKGEKIDEFVNRVFKDFVNEKCKQYENGKLESKYPDFKAIVEEYRDGILLFDLTDEMVWSKAVKDTSGLKKYYNEHKGDFMWGKRVDASIYTVSDTAYVNEIRNLVEKGLSEDSLLNRFGNDSIKVLTVTHKKFSEGDNDIIDKIKWKKGISKNMNQNGKTVFVVVHSKLAPEPKSFNEAKGLITAAYQDYLEKEWIKQLREKYPVVINEEVLKSIVK